VLNLSVVGKKNIIFDALMRRIALGKKGIFVKPWRRVLRYSRLTKRKLADVGTRLQRDGIVIYRNLLPKSTVKRGREAILRLGQFSLLAKPPWPSLLARSDIQNDRRVTEVLEHARLTRVMSTLLGSPIRTTEYKWLRAMPPKLFTGLHTDSTYFGEQPLLTAWIPFTYVPVRRGLVWVPKSQLTELKPRRLGADGTSSGWLTDDASLYILPQGQQWHGTSMSPGDVAIFGPKLLHMTLPNSSPRFRISCDTRWQQGNPSSKGTGPWRTPKGASSSGVNSNT